LWPFFSLARAKNHISANASYNTWIYSEGLSLTLEFDWTELQYVGATTVNCAMVHMINTGASGTASMDYCACRNAIVGRGTFLKPREDEQLLDDIENRDDILAIDEAKSSVTRMTSSMP
jgi:hypothetical protein